MNKHKTGLGYLTRCPRYSKSKCHKHRRRSRWGASSGKLVLGQRALSITLMAVIMVGAISYLALINSRVSKAFEIESLQEQLTDLRKVNKFLEQEAAELQSIQKIQDKVNLDEFIPTTEVSYIAEQDYAFFEMAESTP